MLKTDIRIIAFQLLDIIRLVANECVPPYKILHGSCLYWNTQPNSYCHAQAWCVQNHGELVRGQNAIRLNNKYVVPYFFFIGLTDLLQERGKSRSNWRWTDGSILPNSANLAWNGRNEPHGGADYVVQIRGPRKFGDASKLARKLKYRAVAMCQPRPLQPKSHFSRSHRFRKVPVAVFSNMKDYADENGCSVNINVRSRIQCSAYCGNEMADFCAAFYYHPLTRGCRIVLYTDGSLYFDNLHEWQKFVRY